MLLKIEQSIMKEAQDAVQTQIVYSWITGTLQLRETEVLLPSDCLVGGLEHCFQLLQDYLFLKQFRVLRTSYKRERRNRLATTTGVPGPHRGWPYLQKE